MKFRRSHITAVVIVGLMSMWLLSGLLESKTPTEASKLALETEDALTAVRASVLTARPYTSDVVIRGRTQAIRKVDLRSELKGQVAALPVEKGARVKAGQVICRLSVDDREARLAEAEALARQRELEANAAKRLMEKGHRSETATAGAMAQLDAARAQVAQIKVEMENTAIRAPFDGIINSRPVEIGAYLQEGDICATLVEQNPYLVVGDISEQDVGTVAVGDKGLVRLTTGEELEGTVRFISTVANQATRTFRVELVVPNDDLTLRDGITAMTRIAVRETTAHLLSPAFLVLDDKGTVGVRTVDQNNVVQFKPVNIVGDGPEGVWIKGLDENESVITVGHEYVRSGQEVTVEADQRGGAA
ncbi:MAG: efflux RND transporter periplasmic adaptor subunit [Alphaproteobacteria bacterium]